MPRRIASAEELTRRWPRGWAAPRGWEGTTAGPPRDALPAPSRRTPPPSLPSQCVFQSLGLRALVASAFSQIIAYSMLDKEASLAFQRVRGMEPLGPSQLVK